MTTTQVPNSTGFAQVIGQQQAATAPAGTADSSLQVLMNLAAPVLGPAIEKARTSAFVDGMQRAAAGTTVQQMVQERPWYVNVFGEGDAVAGARLYTTNARSAEVSASIMARMDEYASLDAKGFSDVVKGALDKARTGDAETDAGILQAASRHLPTVFAAHTQANVKHGRVVAAQAHVRNILSSATLLQKAMGGDLPNDRAVQEFRASALTRPVGMGDDEYHSAVAGSLQLLSESGNMHAVWAALGAPELADMPPEVKARLTNAAVANERQLMRMPVADEFHGNLQKLFTTGLRDVMGRGTSEEEATKWLSGQLALLNQNWKRTTGSRQNFVSRTEMVGAENNLHGLFQGLRKAQERDMREQMKLQARAEQAAAERSFVAQSMLSGGYIPATVDVDKRKAVEAVTYREHLYPLLQQRAPLSSEQQSRLERIASYSRSDGASFSEPANYLSREYDAATSGGNIDISKMVQVYNAASRLRRAGVPMTALFSSADTAARMERVYNAYDTAEITQEQTTAPLTILQSLTDPKIPALPEQSRAQAKDVLTTIRDTVNGRNTLFGMFDSLVRFRGLRGRIIEDEAMQPVADRLLDVVQAWQSMSRVPVDVATESVLRTMQQSGHLVTTGRHIIMDTHNAGGLSDRLRAGRKASEVPWVYEDSADGFDNAVRSLLGEHAKVLTVTGGRGGMLAISGYLETAHGKEQFTRYTTYKDIANLMRPSQESAQELQGP